MILSAHYGTQGTEPWNEQGKNCYLFNLFKSISENAERTF